jgi:hypothetical protein
MCEFRSAVSFNDAQEQKEQATRRAYLLSELGRIVANETELRLLKERENLNPDWSERQTMGEHFFNLWWAEERRANSNIHGGAQSYDREDFTDHGIQS